MPYADVGGLRLYYTDEGEGDPVVFLHGFSLDSRMWPDQIAYFHPHYRVICHDARGHGLSDAPATGYSRDHRAEDLSQLADILSIGKFHLVGLSMGGATAIGFAIKYQHRLKSLCLVSSGAAGYSVSKKFSRLDQLTREKGVEATKKRWIDWSLRWYQGRNEPLGRRLEEMMREHSGAIWKDEMRGRYPRTNDLDHVHQIKLPTLIMAGEQDVVFAELARKLHERIDSSQLLTFPQAGHMLNMEIPSEFNHALERFLEGGALE